MRTSGKIIGRGAILAVVAAVIATVTACSPQAAPTSEAVQGVEVGLTSVDLRSVLVPIAQQPETRNVRGPLTLKQAAQLGDLVSPSNVVFSPKSCETYLADAIGIPLNQLDGWVQYGSRVHDTHNDNFIQIVANIPTGANQALIDRVRAAVNRCVNGTVTLDGTATGKITYTERSAPALPGAVSYAVTGNTKFAETLGTPGAKAVERFEMPPGASLALNVAQSCVAAVNVTGVGNTLLVVHEADTGLANELTGGMYNNLQGVVQG